MSLQKELFTVADKLRGSMDAGEYKHVALGMLFLRHLSAAFELTRERLAAIEGADLEDRDEYLAENTFFVPERARWSRLASMAKAPEIGVEIDEAMRAIEEVNPALKDALPKVFGRESLDRAIVSGLIDLYTNMPITGDRSDFDLIGQTYEYFISNFAANEGKRGGEHFTPKSVVRVLVDMLEPTRGRVYDPCCGTGGFFVQSEKFIEGHNYRTGDAAIYGQERNHTTWRLARMNLAIRGIFGDIRWNAEGTLRRNAFPDERFDFILANPPFNQDEWDDGGASRGCALALWGAANGERQLFVDEPRLPPAFGDGGCGRGDGERGDELHAVWRGRHSPRDG